jgi:serine/threonine-protein kinase
MSSADDDPPSLYGDDLRPGAQIGNYVIEAVRSSGGFATVYQARHLALGRLAALKVLRRALRDSASAARRFEQEARAVNLIRHPNIVDIFEIGELDDGRPYFVMEWLDGRDLDELLRERGALTPMEALSIMEELGSALTAAHERGVVHRDLKATNVIAVPAGDGYTVKLVDFGVAKLLDDRALDDADLTATGSPVGTPGSMAPEQIRARAVDARTDVYALGVLLYQLLTGEPPFVAPDVALLQQMHLEQPPPRASDQAPVPRSVDAVILRCLAKHPSDRYASVAALLRDLRRALSTAGQSPRTEQGQGVGAYVEARLPEVSEELQDVLLDDLDAALLAARDRLSGAGLSLVFSSANALLAVARLPEAAAASQALRERVLAAGREIAASRAYLAVAVHVDTLVTRTTDDATRFVDGDLLRIGQWAAHGLVGGQVVLVNRAPSPGRGRPGSK